MHIVHITEFFSPRSETFIYNYVQGLQKLGHRSQVICMNRINDDERPHDDCVEIDHMSRLNPSRIYSGLKRRLGLLEKQEQLFGVARKQLFRILQSSKPDVIHAHFGPMGVMVAPVAQKLNIPLVVTFMGYDGSRALRSERWRKNYKQLNTTVSALIGISNDMCNRLTSVGFDSDKIHRISLGVNIDEFLLRDPTTDFDGKEVRCIHVGRLTAKKSPLKLLEAFNIAYQALSPDINLKLTIAGDGELQDAVEDKVKELKLESQVDILGSVSHKDVIKLFRETHIYTQYCETSHNGDVEGQGVTFVEASASGLPIVSTLHGGIPDVVLNGQTGYLVAEGDTKGMADRIIQLARHPEQWTAFGNCGRKHIEKTFTLDAQLEYTIALYHQVLSKLPSANHTNL